MADRLVKASERILRNNLAIKPQELVAILSSQHFEDDAIVKSIFKGVSRLGAVPKIIVCKSKLSERELKYLSKQLCEFDAVLECTKSPLPISVFELAKRSGTRGLFMFRLPPQAIVRGSQAKQEIIDNAMNKLSSIFKDARRMTIITGKSCTFEVECSGRTSVRATGVAKHGGQFAYFPPGVVAIAPEEYTGNGNIRANGTVVGFGKLREICLLPFKKGKLDYLPIELAKLCGTLLNRRNARILCEIGCGVSRWARSSGTGEDERILGSVHIGLGDNVQFYGRVRSPVHLDMTLKNATLIADSKVIIRRGRLTIPVHRRNNKK